MLCAAQWAPTLTYRDALFGSAADYAALFEREYGYLPPYQAAESSAAVMVWADALQRAGSFDAEAVRAALPRPTCRPSTATSASTPPGRTSPNRWC